MSYPNFYVNAEEYITAFHVGRTDRFQSIDLKSLVLDNSISDDEISLLSNQIQVMEKDLYIKAFKSLWYNDLRSIINKYAKECDKYFPNRTGHFMKWIVNPFEIMFPVVMLVNGVVRRQDIRVWLQKLVVNRMEQRKTK